MTDTAAPALQPEEKPAAKSPHRFARWAHRRHRLLTFMGAVIVFGTFIVKDGLREGLRDLVDTVDKAEDIYLVRSDVQRVQIKIDSPRPEEFLHEVTQTVENAFSRPKGEAGLIELRKLHDTDERAIVMVDNLERLAAKLDNAQMSDLRTIDAEINARVKSLENVSEQLFMEISKGMTGTQKMWDEEQRIYDATADMETSLDKNAALLLKRAKVTRDTAEHRYTIATWASWFFYTLGWGLGLLGRLVGVDTGAGE